MVQQGGIDKIELTEQVLIRYLFGFIFGGIHCDLFFSIE